jgi:hypothetical protein
VSGLLFVPGKIDRNDIADRNTVILPPFEEKMQNQNPLAMKKTCGDIF